MHMAMKQNNIIDVDFDEIQGENLTNIINVCSPEQEQMNYVNKVERWFNLNDNQVQPILVLPFHIYLYLAIINSLFLVGFTCFSNVRFQF